MFWVILIIIVVIIVFVLLQQKDNKPPRRNETHQTGYNYTSSYNHTTGNRTRTIQDCISSEDIKYNIDTKQRQLKAQVEQSRKLVDEARRQGYLTVSTQWMNRFNQMVDVSNTLNQNLIHENQRRLMNDKFHRYTDLHFRSMIMGDLAHQDYEEAKAGRDQISSVLVSIGQKKTRVNRAEKERLYQLKDSFKDATSFLYDRMKSINNETASLRDKIGSECGERGRKWRAERMRGRL